MKNKSEKTTDKKSTKKQVQNRFLGLGGSIWGKKTSSKSCKSKDPTAPEKRRIKDALTEDQKELRKLGRKRYLNRLRLPDEPGTRRSFRNRHDT